MSRALLMPMPGNEAMARALAIDLDAELGQLEIRAFPDGETYLRFITSPAGRSVGIVCTLAHPNDKFLPLLFAAATAKELGAAKVGLIAPYLAYMRQDRRFKPGEGVISRQVAQHLSGAFDWLVTVDPHLHRYGSLGEIYTIPSRVVHAAPLISSWIRANIAEPVIIGPDGESEQWVAAVAGAVGAAYTVLEKVRRGDRDVEIRPRNLAASKGRTPVLVDDIISTGRTMLEAVRLLTSTGSRGPVCIAVHGLFAEGADELLEREGARVVTSNSVPHRTNAIDLTSLIATAMSGLLKVG